MSDPVLTDGQLATIVAAVGGGLAALGVAVRWSAGIIRDAFAETRAAIAVTRAESTQVIRDNTAAFAKLTEWLGRVDVRTEETTRRVVEVHQEISDVHKAPTPEELADAGDPGDSDENDTPVESRPGSEPREARGGRRERAQSPARGAGYSFSKKRP